jgi:hypothetical protein
MTKQPRNQAPLQRHVLCVPSLISTGAALGCAECRDG